MCLLRQDELERQIDDQQPLQPMAPGHGVLGVVVHTTDKEGADRARAEAAAIDSDLLAASWAGQRHAMNHFVQGACDRGLVQAAQEAVPRSQGRSGAGELDAVRSVPPADVAAIPRMGFQVDPLRGAWRRPPRT